MPVQQPLHQIVLVALDLIDEMAHVSQLRKRRETTLQKPLKFRQSGDFRRPARELEQYRHPGQSQCAPQPETYPDKQVYLMMAQTPQSRIAVGLGVQRGVELSPLRRGLLQDARHPQVERVRKQAKFDRVGNGRQQADRQQSLHHRQHSGDVGIAATEIGVVVNFVQEKLSGRAPRRIAQEPIEAGLQPLRLPASQLRKPAQRVSRFLARVMQRLVLLEQATQAVGRIGGDMHGQIIGGTGVSGKSLAQSRRSCPVASAPGSTRAGKRRTLPNRCPRIIAFHSVVCDLAHGEHNAQCSPRRAPIPTPITGVDEMAKEKKTAKKASGKDNAKRSDKASPQEQAERLSRSLSESAQQIWLAGVGAFGRAQEEGGKLFDGLVKEGTTLEQTARKFAGGQAEFVRSAVESTVGQARERAAGTWDRLESAFEDRVHKTLVKLGVPGREDITGLNRRVDTLSSEVRRQSGAPSASRAGKTPSTGPAATPVRKAAVKKAAPASAARVAAKKPAVKKAVRKSGAATRKAPVRP